MSVSCLNKDYLTFIDKKCSINPICIVSNCCDIKSLLTLSDIAFLDHMKLNLLQELKRRSALYYDVKHAN